MRARVFGAMCAAAMCAACKGKHDAADKPGRPVELAGSAAPSDAASDGPGVDAGADWTIALAEVPGTTPLREIVLPSRQDQPRFNVVGPVILGDLAIVGSSQLGFAAVDWRRGALAWTKPAGAHLAPPIVVDDNVLLIGDCASPPEVPDGEALLGCLRSVSASGADTAYIAVHGKTDEVDAFSHAVGDQEILLDGDELWWRRGDAAIVINPVSGVATYQPVREMLRPAFAVDYKDRHWIVKQEGGFIYAHGKTPKDSWKSDRPMSPLVGVVRLPNRPPMLRMIGSDSRFGNEIRIVDLDAMGSLNGAVSWDAVPGMAVLAHALGPIGDIALVVRYDTSLKHDFVVAYSATAVLRYGWPLPETARVDPIGVAVAGSAPDAVVVFHDGDTVTVLPGRGASENATP